MSNRLKNTFSYIIIKNQNLWDAAKAMLKVKFIALNVFV